MASPFCCRSGHIPLSRKPPCPGRQVGEGVSPALDARTGNCVYFVIRQEGGTVRQTQIWPRTAGSVHVALWIFRPADAADFPAPCAGQYEPA